MLTFLPGASNELKPRITVIGVGGAGGNAVNNMITSRLEGVEFIVANTDAQAISHSRTERRIQLGTQVTQGLGAGSRPDIGRAAAEESMEDILSQLAGSNMVFITAGMGGGTGTGAAPVIARQAKENGILTVGVVTKPFHFEGAHRMRTAEQGIEELSQYVDTLIIIPNQNLFRVATERTTFADAFKMADDVLYSGVRGVTDLMVMPGLINLDFADIRTVMGEMGKAMMGTGEAEGAKRATDAAEAAISNPLLDDTSMKGAKGVLINITGGMDMTLFEVDEAANRIRDEVDPEANIIFGSTFDEKLNGRMRVSVVATGIASEAMQQSRPPVISLVTAVSAPQAVRPAAPPPASGFRPTVVGSQPAAQPAVSRVATASAGAGFAATAPMATPMATSVGSAALKRELELDFDRHETQVRDEPAEPAYVTAETVAETSAPAEAAPPCMTTLGKAVSDISSAHAEDEEPIAPAYVEEPQPEGKWVGSLFGRIIGSRRQASPPSSHTVPHAAQPVRPLARPPVREEAPARPQPRLHTKHEAPSTRAEDDLDIPTFLRRQPG